MNDVDPEGIMSLTEHDLAVAKANAIAAAERKVLDAERKVLDAAEVWRDSAFVGAANNLVVAVAALRKARDL